MATNESTKHERGPPMRDAGALALPGTDKASLAEDFLRYVCYTLERDSFHNVQHYQYIALALTLRDRLMAGSNAARHAYYRADSRRVCYLSLEYLMGRSLRNATLKRKQTRPELTPNSPTGVTSCPWT